MSTQSWSACGRSWHTGAGYWRPTSPHCKRAQPLSQPRSSWPATPDTGAPDIDEPGYHSEHSGRAAAAGYWATGQRPQGGRQPRSELPFHLPQRKDHVRHLRRMMPQALHGGRPPPRGATGPAGMDLRIDGRPIHGVHMCPVTRGHFVLYKDSNGATWLWARRLPT